VSAAKQSVCAQHHDWATFGFMRAVASSRTVCRCLIDKRWLHTLLGVVSVPAAAADEEDNHGHADDSVTVSLPQRVGSYLLINFINC